MMPYKARAYGLLIVLGVIALWFIVSGVTDAIYPRVQRIRQRRRSLRTVTATVVDKRTSRLDLSLGSGSASDPYIVPEDTFVTFFLDGQTLELPALDDVYLKTERGLTGQLTCRGQVAVDFEPMK